MNSVLARRHLPGTIARVRALLVGPLRAAARALRFAAPDLALLCAPLPQGTGITALAVATIATTLETTGSILRVITIASIRGTMRVRRLIATTVIGAEAARQNALGITALARILLEPG